MNFLSLTLKKIETEIENARAGKPSGIFAKMNALIDSDMIQALYKASNAGVPIRLIVRGICALRPGVPGLSENIEVRSIIGRFLEHSRIFRFENNRDPDFYIGSGDWMTRNLKERVEALVPIEDADLKAHLEEILRIYWADNTKSHSMLPTGEFIHRQPEAKVPAFDAQRHFQMN